jgi:hypothetical protein
MLIKRNRGLLMKSVPPFLKDNLFLLIIFTIYPVPFSQKIEFILQGHWWRFYLMKHHLQKYLRQVIGVEIFID